MHEILYIERKTGKKKKELVFGQKALNFIYGSSLFTRLFGRSIAWLISANPLFSYFYGILQRTCLSARKISRFCKVFDVDTEEFEKSTFTSFNDFFIRTLKPSVRSVDSNPSKLALPADARYRFFPNGTRNGKLCVKGVDFTLESLLQDDALAKKFDGGPIVLARLCPSDCHRFYFPCTNIPTEPRVIKGSLFSVNPQATVGFPKVWGKNSRVVTLLQTEHRTSIAYIEVGATNVGSIRQTFTPNTRYAKGDEKGYFEFGGSAIILLFERDSIKLDSDLLEYSKDTVEVRANLRESFATFLF